MEKKEIIFAQFNFKQTSIKLFFAFFILCISVKGQVYNFRNYSVRDGLLQSTVKSIAQDKEGYIWFASDGGVSKFDGLYFTNFSKREGLVDASATALFADSRGVLWIGFASGKLMYYYGNKFFEFPISLKDAPKRINKITEDYSGNIWLSTENSGAIKISIATDIAKSTFNVYAIKEGLSDLVIQVIPLRNKSILIITDLGLKMYNPQKNKFDFVKEPDLPVYNYSCAAEDNDGIIWLGSLDKGILKYNPQKHSVKSISEEQNIPNDVVGDLYVDNKNKIWASIWKHGLFLIEGENVKSYNTSNGLASDRVWALMQDNEDNVWCGLQDKGVCSFRGEMIAHYNKQNGLENEVVNSITQDNYNKIWIATNEGISIITNPGKRTFSTKNISLQEHFGNNLVSAITNGPDGNIYAGIFRSGILVISPNNFEVIKVIPLKRNLINVLKFDSFKRLWVGGNDGLTILDLNGELDKTHIFNSDYFSEKQITDILFSSDNSCWLGTRGSEIFRIKNGKIKHFGTRDGLSHPNATALSIDNTGKIWIGTEGGGLFVFDGKKIKKDLRSDKLNSDFITLVKNQGDALWVGTNQGINYFSGYRNYVFSKYEGFNEMETKNNSVFCDRQGLVWFGTINGIASFDFNKFLINSVPPQIRLTYFNIFNERFDYSQNLELSYKQNEIAFHFKSISFTVPENVQYKYILEGSNFKQDWHLIKETNFATYTNLPPGEYEFKVMACNNNGVWNPRPISYKFTISPPFYKTSTFYLFAIISSIVIVGGYIRIRTRKLTKDKLILERQVRDRTKEIANKNEELLEANKIVEFKNKEITDSIIYAKHIQQAILPSQERFEEAFPQSFVFYQPKAIVSGDFYWFADVTNLTESKGEQNIHFHRGDLEDVTSKGSNELHKGHSAESAKLILAVADCTGHGVPGAFMCMVGNSLLNQIINLERVFEPSKILDLLHQGVQEMLKQNETEARDGMDIGVCSIDKLTGHLKFSGALRPMYIFRKVSNTGDNETDYEFENYAPDKFSIGGRTIEERKKFNGRETFLKKGDTFYLFSDGFADQFGGPLGKKLLTRNFKAFLHSIQSLDLNEQKVKIEEFFENWKGDVEQIDDVLVVGIRF